jgi:hypothetical protein
MFRMEKSRKQTKLIAESAVDVIKEIENDSCLILKKHAEAKMMMKHSQGESLRKWRKDDQIHH